MQLLLSKKLTSVSLCQGFNDGLEELCKIQKGWAIPDKEQRDLIRHNQKKVVSDAYRAFLQRSETLSHKQVWSRGFDLKHRFVKYSGGRC